METRVKIFALLILGISSVALAEGPRYGHKEPEKQLEFENVYKDLKTKVDKRVLTDNTSGQILVGQGVGVNPVWQSTTSFNFGNILQISTFTTDTSSATTSATFVPTNSTISITLRQANSKVFVLSTGALLISTNDAALAALYRGSTSLHGASGQCQNVNPTAAATQGVGCTMFAWDTPNSVGPHTYTVRIARGAAGTVTYGNGSTASLTVFEIGQ